MRKLQTVLVTVAAVLMVAGVAAQNRPNFSGKWSLVFEPGAPAPPRPLVVIGESPDGGRAFFFFNQADAPPRFIVGDDLTIAQDATTLRVEYPTPRPFTVAYKLDGSETRNAPRPPAAGDVVSTAAWDGNKLVITSTQTVALHRPATLVIKQALSLAADGTLIVEDIREGKTTRVVYKKN